MREETYQAFDDQRRKHTPTKNEIEHDLDQARTFLMVHERLLSDIQEDYASIEVPNSKQISDAQDAMRIQRKCIRQQQTEIDLLSDQLPNAETDQEQAERLDRELHGIKTDAQMMSYITKKQRMIDQKELSQRYSTIHDYSNAHRKTG